MVAPYVAAVDVNMGCPVHFSTSGGMGSALLRKPETVERILTALVAALPCPVTCKIRLLGASRRLGPSLVGSPVCTAPHVTESEEETAQLAQLIQRCGVAALGVHGRFIPQKPREPAHWSRIAAVVRAVPGLPVIANGDVFAFGDFERLCSATGAVAAMCARAAQWDASVFRAEGPAPGAEVRRRYVEACLAWDNPLSNSKYCLREMLAVTPGALQCAEAVALNAAKTTAALAALYGLDAGDAAAYRAAAAARAGQAQQRDAPRTSSDEQGRKRTRDEL